MTAIEKACLAFSWKRVALRASASAAVAGNAGAP